MIARNRSGFTLVELLAVVVIISMLIALLLPAVIAARNAAQKAECMNNQAELSKALLQYDLAKEKFPGYVNRFGNKSTLMSWMVVSFPYLGREDLWKAWRDVATSATPPEPRVDQLVCPSSSPSTSAPTSYVANCGKSGENGAAYGVFHDHSAADRSTWTLVSASNIPDGAQATLLFGENLQAGQWSDLTETSVGMLWQDSPGACGQINRCLDDTTQDVDHARPSSNHGAGVVVSFCDGRQYFLSEDIDYNVYQHLMTPDSLNAGLTGMPSDDDY